MPPNEREPYETRSEDELREECRGRRLNRNGLKHTMVARLVKNDKEAHMSAVARVSFNNTNDPTGYKEGRFILEETAFESRCSNSIYLSEIEFHESQVRKKRIELAKVLENLKLEEEEKLEARTLRVESFKDRNAGTVEDQAPNTIAARYVHLL